jgi:hypothetical protein
MIVLLVDGLYDPHDEAPAVTCGTDLGRGREPGDDAGPVESDG